MKTKYILYFITLLFYSISIHSAKAQNYFKFGGDESLNSGVVAWIVNPTGNTVEPVKSGHTLQNYLNGGYSSGEYAYYYLASRDYSNIDPPTSQKVLISGYDNIVGFPKFSAALKKYNKTISDIKISIGLLTLRNDQQGIDWWVKGPIEKRIYHSTDYFYLILDNDTLIRCKIPTVKQVINYNQPFDDVDVSKLFDDSIASITDFTIPENHSQNAINSFSKDIANVLTNEIGNYGIRFIIPKVTYYTTNSKITSGYGREGSFFNIEGIIEKGYMPICRNQNTILYFDGNVNGNVVTINNSSISSNNNLLWLWTFGDGFQSNQKNVLLHKFNISDGNDYYKVCLTAYDTSNGCKTQYCRPFQVGIRNCNAEFSVKTNDTANAIELTNTSSAIGVNWYWTFGDGSVSTLRNPTHTYSNPGVYDVSLSTYRKQDGCTDRKTTFVKVGIEPLKADFDYYINLKKKFILFNNKSTGTVGKTFWDFGNGHYSNSYNPLVPFPKAGTYNVCLTVKDIIGESLDSYCEKIQIDSLPVCKAKFTYYIDSVSNNVIFKNTSIGKMNTTRWEFGDGSQSLQSNPTYKFKASGFYKVKLTIYNDTTKCTDEHTEEILVSSMNKDCHADFNYQVDWKINTIRCFNHSTGISINKYIWNFGDDTTSYVDENPIHKMINNKKRIFPVCLNIYDAQNKCKNYICKNIIIDSSVTSNCKANFIYSIDSINKKINFIDRSYGNIANWQWTFGDGKSSVSQNPTNTYSANGYYKVHLRVSTSGQTCVDDHIQIINLNNGNKGLRNAFSYFIGDKSFDKGIFPVDFKGATYGDGATGEWDFGDGTGTSNSEAPTHYYDSIGNYYVCYKIFDPITNDSCKTCDTVKVLSTGINEINSHGNSLSCYPNPFSDFTHIRYSISSPTNVEISIYDITGNKFLNLTNTNQNPGIYLMEFNNTFLTDGLYYVQMKTTEQTLIKKIIIIK